MASTLKSPACVYLLVIVAAAGASRPVGAQASSVPSLDPAFNLGVSDAAATGERAPAYTFGIDAGVGETDNVSLTSRNPVSQTMATADTDFSVNRRSRLFDVNAVGDFTYLDYLQHAYGSQLLGRFDGVANAAIIPGRLIWVVRDDFGQSALDPYTPVTPTNLENINYVTTGPDLKLRLAGVDFVDVSARYARAQYQTSPFNSNRLLGSVAVGRDISAGASISLNANIERVLFENTIVNTDFSRSSGFGRYELHGARTDFIGELGVTVVNQSAGNGASDLLPPSITGLGPAGGPPNVAVTTRPGGSLTGPLAKFELSRRVSPSAKMIFTAGQDLTDASSSFSNQTVGPTTIGTITPAALTSDTYRMTYGSAGWQYMRNRTTLGVTARWEKDIYPGLSSLDSTRSSATFNVDRRLTRALTAQLVGAWSKSNYPNTVFTQGIGSTDYANTLIGTSLTWRHGHGLEIKLRYDHNAYAVSNGNTGYHENRAFLTIGYRPAIGSATDAQ